MSNLRKNYRKHNTYDATVTNRGDNFNLFTYECVDVGYVLDQTSRNKTFASRGTGQMN